MVENIFGQRLGSYWPALGLALEKIPATESASGLHPSQDNLVWGNSMLIDKHLGVGRVENVKHASL